MAALCDALAPGATHTITFTPCCHSMVALVAPCFNRRAEPTSASDTATVSTAATVINRLRHRLVVASRATYPAETGISAPRFGGRDRPLFWQVVSSGPRPVTW